MIVQGFVYPTVSVNHTNEASYKKAKIAKISVNMWMRTVIRFNASDRQFSAIGNQQRFVWKILS